MALLDLSRAPHGGSQRHLPEWESQPRIIPTTIIDHSIVGTGEGGFRHFRDTSVLESHFIVCGAGDAQDGWIWQLMDTSRQADANLQANAYAVSIETGDLGDPDRQRWTDRQLAALTWLHNELVRVHPTIPRRRSVSCKDPGGLGYHTLHGAPSCWTPVSKSCPGMARRPQWERILLPAFLAGDQPSEDDMFTDDDRKMLKWLRDNVSTLRDEGVRMTAMGDPDGPSDRQTNNLATVLTRLDRLEDLVSPPPSPPAK